MTTRRQLVDSLLYSTTNINKTAGLSRAAKGALLAPILASPKLIGEATAGASDDILSRLISGYSDVGAHIPLIGSLDPLAQPIAGLGLVAGAGAGIGKLIDIAANSNLRERAVKGIENMAVEALNRPSVQEAVRTRIADSRNLALAGLLAGGTVGGIGGYMVGKDS